MKFLGYFTLFKNAARKLCLWWFDIHNVFSLDNSRLGYLIFTSLKFAIHIPKIVITSSFSSASFTQIVASASAILASVANCNE